MIKNKSPKNKVFLILLLVLILPLSSSLMDFSSASYQIERGITDVTIAAKPIFQALFGDYGSSDFLFVKVLLFILMIIVIKSILVKVDFFGNNSKLVAIISIIVPILSIRYMGDNEIIRGILLPYSTLGIAITTLLPFILFFYFIHFSKMGGFGRRISWIFFLIIFLVLWNSRYSSLSPLGNRIYWWTGVIAVVLFMFDRNIHNYFKKWELDNFYKGANQKTIAALQSEYLNIINVDSPAANARKTSIENQLKKLGANLP